MPKPDALVVASTTNWIHNDLAQAREENNSVCNVYGWIPPIIKSTGLGLPRLKDRVRPAIWCSTAHAARLQQAGLSLPLVAPGPEWLAEAPERLKGRRVYHWTLDALTDSLHMDDEHLAWVKLAEMKDDRLLAQRTTVRDFVTTATILGAPAKTNIHVCLDHLPIFREDRYFILDHTVVAGSPYLKGLEIWDYDKHVSHPDWDINEESAQFAQYVATMMKSKSPRTYTLDIATVVGGRQGDYHVVLEVNPVWSSAYYGAELTQVLQCLMVGVDYSERDLNHRWQPDPWLLKQANFKAVLKPE